MPLYPYILIFVKPTAFILAAVAAKKPFLEIFLIFVIPATILNFLVYYFPNFIVVLKNLIINPEKEQYRELLTKTKGIIEAFGEICDLFIRAKKNVPDLAKIEEVLTHAQKEIQLQHQTRLIIHRWTKRFRVVPLILFFIDPIIPIPLFKQICLLAGRLFRIPFFVFILITIVQFFLIYFLGHKIF